MLKHLGEVLGEFWYVFTILILGVAFGLLIPVPDDNVSSITLYSNDGNVIKQWNGELTLHQNDYQCYFDFEGRKVIVRGGILVAQ